MILRLFLPIVLSLALGACGDVHRQAERDTVDADETHCGPGWHPKTKGSLDCVASRVVYGAEQSLSGTMLLSLEQHGIRLNGRAGQAEPVIWMSFEDSELETCIASLAAGRASERPLNVPVRIRGRLAEVRSGDGFGHMNMFPGEVRVSQILVGNPCGTSR